MPVGLYISVPFCRTKCSYCNFASDVFSKTIFDRYVDRVCADLENARSVAEGTGGLFEHDVDSVYLGGGTPTLLTSQQLERIFVTVRQNFRLLPGCEITVECAPGTLTTPVVETLVGCGVNRVSLGVQSFVDQEAASVGRLHKRTTTLDDIARLRAAGIANINVDLIAGLPHQTAESWQFSLAETIATEVPHVSVYMLEVDEDSRLGRELLAGGTRYHAHFVPDDELTADLYVEACRRLNDAGVHQYEISNFARPDFASRHNLKYWTRLPYLGFGVDAHSMLLSGRDGMDAVRFSMPDALEAFVAGRRGEVTHISREAALEECFFLGLRLTDGIDLAELRSRFGDELVSGHCAAIAQAVSEGLLTHEGQHIRLTERGRLLSNEVFALFLSSPEAVH